METDPTSGGSTGNDKYVAMMTLLTEPDSMNDFDATTAIVKKVAYQSSEIEFRHAVMDSRYGIEQGLVILVQSH